MDESKTAVFGLPFPEDTIRALISIFDDDGIEKAL